MHYGFRSVRSIGDVLTVSSHRISRISEGLDSTYGDRAVVLDTSKAFDQVWHKGLLYKFPVMTYLVECIPSINRSILAEA